MVDPDNNHENDTPPSSDGDFISSRPWVMDYVDVNGLSNRIGVPKEDDVVVWDNFPDDMVMTDLDDARNVLESIGSSNVKRFLVALKPRYIEIYRDLIHNGILEFHTCEVSFDKERIKSIMRTYGMAIAQFRQLYRKYIEGNIEKISRILWQMEPTPLTILDYYKELTNKIEQIQETGIYKTIYL
jgi:hypothetical protein